MVEISVIIPVYNTGEYLRNCLDSIINQTFKDFEIICMNDGSTDNSLEILEEYQKLDSRIKVFSQDNQGQGAARNNALKHVSGKYTYFMDSDDTLELIAFDNLYRLAEDKSLDLIIFKLINVDEDSGKKYSDRYYDMIFLKHLVGTKVFNYEDVGGDLYHIAVSPPGKFFKSELIQDMKFPTDLIFEDNPFFIEAFLKAKRVYFYNRYLYNRLRRSDSVMTTNESYIDVIPISNMILDITKKYGNYEKLRDKFFNRKIFSTYYRFTLVDDSFKPQFFEELKKDFGFYKMEIEENINLETLNEFIFKNALFIDNYKDFEYSVNFFKKELDSFNNRTMRLLKSNEIARLDIKNFGIETNEVVVLQNSDIDSTEKSPKWYNNEKGKGISIESGCGNLNLKLKMVNDGRLRFSLKGIDLKGYGIEPCIDYISCIINGEEYLSNHNACTHDEPFIVSIPVKDAQIIDVTIKWMTYDKIGDYVEELNEKNRKHERLTKQSFKLMNKVHKLDNKNQKLKKELNELYSSNSWKVTKPLRKIRGN